MAISIDRVSINVLHGVFDRYDGVLMDGCLRTKAEVLFKKIFRPKHVSSGPGRGARWHRPVLQ
jgi:hypothetical protein